MNNDTECGCELINVNGVHYCGKTPPYHFENHVCLYCGYEWQNNN